MQIDKLTEVWPSKKNVIRAQMYLIMEVHITKVIGQTNPGLRKMLTQIFEKIAAQSERCWFEGNSNIFIQILGHSKMFLV